MLGFLRLWFGLLVRCFRSHRSLLVENLALRQQLIVLKRRHPKPTLEYHDKLFWVFARRFWSALEAVSNRGHSRHRCSLASCRIPLVLGLAFASSSRFQQEEDQLGCARPHLPNGGRESHLGSSAHPW